MFRLAVQPRRAAFMTATALVAGGSYLYLQKQTQLDSSDSPVTKRRPSPLWAPMSRDQMLAHLRSSGTFIKRTAHGGPEPGFVPKDATPKDDDDVFDLLVVGGGATGAGTAVDAASRGLKVAMVERDDFSSGTSSKSTKLVHGGVRYLQKAVMELDYGQYKLVKEALRERRIFLETAPHLSHMLPILLPLYAWWQLPYYYAGCKMYDILAGKENMESSYWMTKGKALEAFPMLKPDGLVGAVVYYDGQHNDSRMNISLVATAVQHGAIVANQCEVVALHKKPDPTRGGEERICSATLKDRMTGEEFDVRCRGVVNATGPFSDGVRKLDEPSTQEIVAPSSGVHITLPVSRACQTWADSRTTTAPRRWACSTQRHPTGVSSSSSRGRATSLQARQTRPPPSARTPSRPRRRSPGSSTRSAATSRPTSRCAVVTSSPRGRVSVRLCATLEPRTPSRSCATT